MNSNPINVKINNFDMKNGMNATFNINGKDFDIMISPDDINKYFSSNTNIPIANSIPNDESDNEFKGTIAIDDDNSDSNLRPEDENAIDNAAEKIFENNRNDGNKILTGLMSNLLEELKNDSGLTAENKNTVDAFMKTPKHFRHEGGGGAINWVDNNNDNDNVNELINGSFEKSLLGIDTSKIIVHQIPDYINNNNDDDDDNTAKMKKWKFSQFLINAAFIQQYYNKNTVQIENLKELKGEEYDKLSDDDDDTSYIFSALFRIICYDNSLITIGSLSDIVSYDGPITEYKNRADFKLQNSMEYNTVLDNANNMETQQTTEIKHTNAEVCPTENLLAIDLGHVNLNNPINDGNVHDDNANVDLSDDSDALDKDGKSTLPIQNIRNIIKDTDNTNLKNDFKVLYTQYIAIRSALKTVDRAISTVRDEIPKMKNIIEEESKRDTANKSRLDKRKKKLNDKLTEERQNIKDEDDKIIEAIAALENHENDEIVDGNIIDNIKQYRTTYIVELFKLYKEFESISQPNKSWFSGLNYFHRKPDEQTPGRFSGFMRAIGNVFKRRDARIAPIGGKQNRTKRLKGPRNKSLKKRNH